MTVARRRDMTSLRVLSCVVGAGLLACCIGGCHGPSDDADAGSAEDASTLDGAADDAAPGRDASDALDGGVDVLDAAPIDAALATPRCGAAPGLRAAFLAVTNASSAAFFARAVDAMAALGMTDVVIQTVAYPPVGGVPNAVDARNLLAVLDAAKLHHMRALIGLAQSDGNGDPARAADAVFVAKLIEQSKQSARDVVAAYGAHEAFDGLYLSMEPWTPSTETELGHLPEYVQQVSVYARSIAPHAIRIAVSPFVSAGALHGDPAITEAVYRSMLATASIDIVMLQDGVGALRLEGAAISDVVPLFRAMKSACAARSVALWANVESFAMDASGASRPTTFERLLLQLQAASATTVDVITYELESDLFAEGSGGAAAGELAARYRAACTFTAR